MARACRHLRKTGGAQLLQDGPARDAHLLGNLDGGHAFAMQRHHPLLGRLTPPAPFLLPQRFAGRPFGRAGGGILRRDGTRSLGQDRMMAGQAALQDLARILQEMKAVGDLFGLWRPQRREERRSLRLGRD
jgi:hypothetical protein